LVTLCFVGHQRHKLDEAIKTNALMQNDAIHDPEMPWPNPEAIGLVPEAFESATFFNQAIVFYSIYAESILSRDLENPDDLPIIRGLRWRWNTTERNPTDAACIAMVRILSVHLFPRLVALDPKKTGTVSIKWGTYPRVENSAIKMILDAYSQPFGDPLPDDVLNMCSEVWEDKEKKDEWVYALAFRCSLRDCEGNFNTESLVHEGCVPIFASLLNRPSLRHLLFNMVTKHKKRMV